MVENKKPEDFLPLTDNYWHILMVLGDGHSWHGYAINKQVEANTEGKLRLGPATLYRTIHSLKSDGLIEEVSAPIDETDPRRVYYCISGLGKRVVKAQITWYKERAQSAQQKPAFNRV